MERPWVSVSAKTVFFICKLCQTDHQRSEDQKNHPKNLIFSASLYLPAEHTALCKVICQNGAT